jgi:hypothetical protein
VATGWRAEVTQVSLVGSSLDLLAGPRTLGRMQTNRRFAIAFGCMAAALALGALDARAQYSDVTSLSCQMTSCDSKPGNLCPDVGSLLRITIDLEHARARGGTLPEWVDATIEPDLVTFSRNVVDASGMDRQSYSVNRASLTMTWRWLSTPTGAPDGSVDASARYQCQLVHPQF